MEIGVFEVRRSAKVLLYEFKLGTTAAETARKINMAFGDGTLDERTAQRWFQKFRSGNESLEDNDRIGRPSDIDEDQLRATVEEDPRRSASDIAERLGVHKTTVSRHLQQIGKRKKLDQSVPHKLTEIPYGALPLRDFIYASFTQPKQPFLARIITCDEKWILYDNRRRSSQWLDKDMLPKRFQKPNVHQKKVLLTVWWSATSIIHYNLPKSGEIVTAQTFYRELEKYTKNDSVPHVSKMTIQKLHHMGYKSLPRPPYSPDLSPTDYHIFRHLDHFLNRKQLKNQEEAKTAFEELIASKTPDFCSTGINALLSRSQKWLRLSVQTLWSPMSRWGFLEQISCREHGVIPKLKVGCFLEGVTFLSISSAGLRTGDVGRIMHIRMKNDGPSYALDGPMGSKTSADRRYSACSRNLCVTSRQLPWAV
uniref:HTH_48 domain-containing protein n=1 Tax=Trichuris muris TaxID=70415 RepID=A0A5S6QI01_TRIMR